MQQRNIEILELFTPLTAEFYQKCSFCDKLFFIKNDEIKYQIDENPYCPFCLRHNHHLKNSKNILILSFTYIFNFYHKTKKFWRIEILDMIENHKKIGLKNPAFSYDEESCLWFVDFNKIGENQIDIETIYSTIKEIIASFRLDATINVDKFQKKYTKAIEVFYENRKRPTNRKILHPSFKGCTDLKLNFENDDFSLKNLLT